MLSVVYAPTEGKSVFKQVNYVPGLTVADVIEQSGLQQVYPEVSGLPVGIFSNIVTLKTLVKPGDRVEIYRPLLIDPKEKRRQRGKKT